MLTVLTYSTSYFKDKFSIVAQDGCVNNLYKSSWLGDSLDLAIGEERYRIESNGWLLNRQVIIRDRNQKEIARISASIPFLGLFRNWKATFSSGTEYQWKEEGLLNRKWQWMQGAVPVVSSEERNGLFSIHGQIQVAPNFKEAELLSQTGLYLRSSYGAQSIATSLLGLAVLFFLGLRYFSA